MFSLFSLLGSVLLGNLPTSLSRFRSFRKYSFKIFLLFSFWAVSDAMRFFIHPIHQCWLRIPLIHRRHVVMHTQIEVFCFKGHSRTTRRLQCRTGAYQTFYICTMWLRCKDSCKCNFSVREFIRLDKPLESFSKRKLSEFLFILHAKNVIELHTKLQLPLNLDLQKSVCGLLQIG